MSNIFITGKNFANVADVAHWANQLVGQPIPNSNQLVKDILQFQVISETDSLSVLVLVSTERRKSMSSMVLDMRKDLDLNEED